MRKMFFDCDPMQRETIGRQYFLLPDKRWLGTKHVLARGVRVMTESFGMRTARQACVRGGGV